jgi:cytochrome P450
VIGELLGVPSVDRPRFRELVTDWSSVLEILNPPAVDRADAAAGAIIDYFTELSRARRRAPEEDLVSALVSDGAGLGEEEVVTTAALILAAGFETTTGLLANGLLALVRHPEQVQRLRDENGLARPAVGELLRSDSPVQMICGRTALLRRFPSLAIDGAAERRPGLAIHSYRTLPLSLS